MKLLTQIRTLCCSDFQILLYVAMFVLLFTNCEQTAERRPSPLRQDSLELNGNLIKVIYSSPGVKGRKIWGELVSYDKLWRTGANEATVLVTPMDIMIDTFLLAKGKYSIFTIPGQQEWEVIFNKEWDQWGTYSYRDSLDAARITVNPSEYDSLVERMRIYFEDGKVKFRWAKLGWEIPISLSE